MAHTHSTTGSGGRIDNNRWLLATVEEVTIIALCLLYSSANAHAYSVAKRAAIGRLTLNHKTCAVCVCVCAV